jgi:transcriptional regulator with XRE-family HTH domain
LAEKLLRIRLRLNLTQEALTERIEKLGLVRNLDRAEISDFERGRREPDALTQLSYARLINVCLDVLVDDGMDLPEELPQGTNRCVEFDKKTNTRNVSQHNQNVSQHK